MAKIARCLISCLSTFALSAGIHWLLPGSSHSDEVVSAQLEMIPPVPLFLPDPSPTPVVTSAVPRISQEEVIRFPQVGAVRVSAHEYFGRDLSLTFTDPESGRMIQSCDFGSYR